MAIYLKLDGIEGDVTTEGFTKQIDILAFNFNAMRNVMSAARGAANRESSEPQLSEVSLSKYWDAVSSSKLLEYAVGGNMQKKATLTFTTTTTDKVEKFLEVIMENVAITNISTSASGQDRPMENLSFNFTKIEYTPYEIDPKGDPKKKDVWTYDLTKMKGKV